MKSLSESSIKTLAGDAPYHRGLEYYNQGRVENLIIDGSRISASVNGSQQYHVVLNHTARIFDGSCDCPASDNFDFCKHCVAASLAYYYQTQTNQEIADTPNADPVLMYLNTLTKPQLTEELAKQLKRDPSVYDLWLLRAEMAGGHVTLKDLRKRITKAIPYKPSGLWRFQDVARYFNETQQLLEALQEAVLSLPAPDANKLSVYAVERLEKTYETIDDSSGYRFPTEEMLHQWFHSSLDSDEWSKDQRVSAISTMILNEKFSYDLLNLPHDILYLLEQDEIKAVYKNIDVAWTKLKLSSDASASDNKLYRRLERVLLAQAIEDNNIDRELEIHAKGAINIDRCLKLVHRCIECQRLDEASSWLEYASKIDTLRPHDVLMIEACQVDLWLAQGNYQSALEVQWSHFEESEELSDLKDALQSADKLNQKHQVVEQAIEFLAAKIDPKQDTQKNRLRADTLVSVYLHSGRIKDATSLARLNHVHVSSLMAVVNATTRQTQATGQLILKAVNELVGLGSNDTYERAVSFLRKVYDNAEEQNRHFVETIIKAVYDKPDNKRKTNFIKLLKAAFEFI